MMPVSVSPSAFNGGHQRSDLLESRRPANGHFWPFDGLADQTTLSELTPQRQHWLTGALPAPLGPLNRWPISDSSCRGDKVGRAGVCHWCTVHYRVTVVRLSLVTMAHKKPTPWPLTTVCSAVNIQRWTSALLYRIKSFSQSILDLSRANVLITKKQVDLLVESASFAVKSQL